MRHVRGYVEEGAITTSFDMRVLNGIDRYSLVLLALKHLNIDSTAQMKLQLYCEAMLRKHHDYIREYGKDMPEVVNFRLNR
ncbi:MAG: hypothetical protein K2J20_02000 [Bacilli bacterium]|nr:hypothetical protein [Bacilli bacterium]